MSEARPQKRLAQQALRVEALRVEALRVDLVPCVTSVCEPLHRAEAAASVVNVTAWAAARSKARRSEGGEKGRKEREGEL